VPQERQDAIGYLLTAKWILREKLGKKRILLNDDNRRQLAAKGKILGRKMLEEPAVIVTPGMILRRHRQLLARHCGATAVGAISP
jgi:putative transposase